MSKYEKLSFKNPKTEAKTLFGTLSEVVIQKSNQIQDTH